MTDEIGGSSDDELCRSCWNRKQKGSLESEPGHRAPDRLAGIWGLLDGVAELAGDARAYYEACSSRGEGSFASPVDHTDTEVAQMLHWSRLRVKKAREALGAIIRPYW
jgi:hypothetical protein